MERTIRPPWFERSERPVKPPWFERPERPVKPPWFGRPERPIRPPFFEILPIPRPIWTRPIWKRPVWGRPVGIKPITRLREFEDMEFNRPRPELGVIRPEINMNRVVE